MTINECRRCQGGHALKHLHGVEFNVSKGEEQCPLICARHGQASRQVSEPSRRLQDSAIKYTEPSPGGPRVLHLERGICPRSNLRASPAELTTQLTSHRRSRRRFPRHNAQRYLEFLAAFVALADAAVLQAGSQAVKKLFSSRLSSSRSCHGVTVPSRRCGCPRGRTPAVRCPAQREGVDP